MGFLWVWEHQAGLALNPNFPVGFGSASLFPLVGPFHPLQSPPADSQGPIFLPIPHQGMQRGPHSPSRRCQGAWLSLGTASSRDHSPGTPGSPPSLCHAGSSVGTPMLGAAGLATLGSTGMNFLGSLGSASSTNCHWGGLWVTAWHWEVTASQLGSVVSSLPWCHPWSVPLSPPVSLPESVTLWCCPRCHSWCHPPGVVLAITPSITPSVTPPVSHTPLVSFLVSQPLSPLCHPQYHPRCHPPLSPRPSRPVLP